MTADELEVKWDLADRKSCNILASSPPHDGVPHSDPLYMFGVPSKLRLSERWPRGVGKRGLIELELAFEMVAIFLGAGVVTSGSVVGKGVSGLGAKRVGVLATRSFGEIA